MTMAAGGTTRVLSYDRPHVVHLALPCSLSCEHSQHRHSRRLLVLPEAPSPSPGRYTGAPTYAPARTADCFDTGRRPPGCFFGLALSARLTRVVWGLAVLGLAGGDGVKLRVP